MPLPTKSEVRLVVASRLAALEAAGCTMDDWATWTQGERRAFLRDHDLPSNGDLARYFGCRHTGLCAVLAGKSRRDAALEHWYTAHGVPHARYTALQQEKWRRRRARLSATRETKKEVDDA